MLTTWPRVSWTHSEVFSTPEIVEHQNVGGQHRPQHVHLVEIGSGAVGVANELQEVSRLIEIAARPLGAHHGLENGDRQVRLADAVGAHEQQALLDDGKALDECRRLAMCIPQGVVVLLEVIQLAVTVALLNAGDPECMLCRSRVPAVATRDARDTFDLDRFPSGVVAERAGHSLMVTRKGPCGIRFAGGYSLFDACGVVSSLARDWGVCRTRSVGADLTSAVLRRCSQSSMPRASSRFT